MAWWHWLIVIGVLVVFYALLLVRQKKQEKQSKELLSSFKPGDKVVTHIGVYGKIKRIYNTTYGKVCVLEIGTTNKIEIELDMRYVAAIDDKTAAPEEPTTTSESENKEPEVKQTEESKTEKKPKQKTKKQ